MIGHLWKNPHPPEKNHHLQKTTAPLATTWMEPRETHFLEEKQLLFQTQKLMDTEIIHLRGIPSSLPVAQLHFPGSFNWIISVSLLSPNCHISVAARLLHSRQISLQRRLYFSGKRSARPVPSEYPFKRFGIWRGLP